MTESSSAGFFEGLGVEFGNAVGEVKGIGTPEVVGLGDPIGEGWTDALGLGDGVRASFFFSKRLYLSKTGFAAVGSR